MVLDSRFPCQRIECDEKQPVSLLAGVAGFVQTVVVVDVEAVEFRLLEQVAEGLGVLVPVFAVDDEDGIFALHEVDEGLRDEIRVAQEDDAFRVDEVDQFKEFFLRFGDCLGAGRHEEQLVILEAVRGEQEDGLLGAMLRELDEQAGVKIVAGDHQRVGARAAFAFEGIHAQGVCGLGHEQAENSGQQNQTSFLHFRELLFD